MTKAQFDITPHPRILSVLGEIEFKPWQCVAELLDNCIDGFLEMQRVGTPINDPTASVAFGRDTVVVKDNGPGMSVFSLETAVKAGWSSREKFGSLGLYGVGFNIATARLGSVTNIWTTQRGDREWYGLKIDLREMARGGTYLLDVQTQPKSDPDSSGTRIEVTGIREDWKNFLSSGNWLRSNMINRLARVYGAMLRDINPQPIKFSLIINNRKVTPWEHCVWPAEWTVYKKSEGDVSPIQEFDQLFGTKYVSKTTGDIFDSPDELEPEDTVEVRERIYGWLGIQRYADESEYGVDILRNGRKIEIDCKDVFNWEDNDGRVYSEYPIDDPRQKGRIVGEIHLDHGYVHYTKNKFEREHYSWTQLLQAVRKNEPLTKRSDFGLADVNTSALGLLFRVFRRNSLLKGQSGTLADILFIKENDKAKTWANEWRKGTLEYRNDKKWREELDRVELDPKKSVAPVATPTDGDNGSEAGDIPSDDNGKNAGEPSNGNYEGETDGDGTSNQTQGGFFFDDDTQQPEEEAPPVNRQLLPEFNLHITGIGSAGKSYNVEVYAMDTTINSGSQPAWVGRLTERNVYEIDVHLQHPAFDSSSLQIRDAILAEVAYLITSEEKASLGSRNVINYSDILVALRSRYAMMDSLEFNQLRVEINTARTWLTDCLSRGLSEDEQRKLVENLPQEDIQRIELAYARGSMSASILSYLEVYHLAHLFLQFPSVFFELNCFNRAWIPNRLSQNPTLLEEHQRKLSQDIWTLLSAMGEFISQSSPSLELSRAYLAFIRACINRLQDFISR